MIEKNCSFFGHRKIEFTQQEKTFLKNIIYNLIVNENVTNFFFGGFGEFDDLSYQIVSKLKLDFPDIKRIYVFEDYKFIDRPWKRPLWIKKEDYEEFIYFNLEYNGFYKRIFFRNCEIVKNSDFVVFYVKSKNNSGAYKILQYANKIKKFKRFYTLNYKVFYNFEKVRKIRFCFLLFCFFIIKFYITLLNMYNCYEYIFNTHYKGKFYGCD